MSRPSKRIAPPSLPRLPEIWPIRVVFPAPFGPIRACTSPGFTSSVTSSVATTPPKRFETFLSSSMLLPREHARDALGSEEHDRKQHGADSQTRVLLIVREYRGEPIDAVVGDQVLEPEQRRSADHSAPKPSHAAHDHHHHERARLGPLQHVRVPVLAVAREEGAGESAGGPGDHEADELVAVYRKTDRPRAFLGFADRPDHSPQARMREPMQGVKAGRPRRQRGGIGSQNAGPIEG